MGKNKHKKENHQKLEKINIMLLMLSAMGALLSLYLWSVHLSGSDVLCATGGCDLVLKGIYSEIAGVPVATYGVGFYALLMLLFFIRTKVRDLFINQIIYMSVIVGVIFTLYLRYLELAKIGEICLWCWGSVVVMLFISVLSIMEYRLNSTKN